MDNKNQTWTLCFPAKENPNMEKALFDWPIVLRYDVKAKYRLISRKFFGHKVFSAERSLNRPKTTRVSIRSAEKPIKSLDFRSFVVSVLFARFHFKVIRKSLYRMKHCVSFMIYYFLIFSSFYKLELKSLTSN